MSLVFNNQEVQSVYRGGVEIQSIYKGSTELWSAFKPQTIRFNYTGAVQTWTVPRGCTKLIVDCVGAAGGRGKSSSTGYGSRANGGRVQCTISVSYPTTVNIYVGGAGVDGYYNQVGTSKGGWNGGGTGFSTVDSYTGQSQSYASGGGASDLRFNGSSLSDRVVVAGGGGGGAYLTMTSSGNLYGGAGGGLTGGKGIGIGTGGSGGTQTAGGAGGYYGDSMRGSNGTLGNGGIGMYLYTTYLDLGTGGGGGYYGGGAGSYYGAGGGSSYTNATLCSNVTHTQGYSSATGNGWIIITTSNE